MAGDLSNDFLKSLAAQAGTFAQEQKKAAQDRDAEYRLEGEAAEQFGKKIFDFAEHLKSVPADSQGRQITVRRNSNQIFRHFLTLTVGPKDAQYDNMKSSYPSYPELSVTIERDRISVSDASRRGDYNGGDYRSFNDPESALHHIGAWLVKKAPSVMQNINAVPKEKALPKTEGSSQALDTCETEIVQQQPAPQGISLMQRLKIRKP